MTRRFRGLVHCPHCGKQHSAETKFERWMRGEKSLDSQDAGVVRFDCDVLLHRYKFSEKDGKGSRDLQCMMFVEVKSWDAEPTDAQRDTLSLLAQVLRNRRRNMHRDKRGRHAADHSPPCKALSHKTKKRIALLLYGGHLLQLSGESPEDSETIRWDGKPIDVDMLLKLLRFELDPDSLKPVDHRRRYRSFGNDKQQKRLFE